MNRRELFTLCSQLAAGLACAQIARVLPEINPPIKLERSQHEVVIHIHDNPYIPTEYAAKLEGLTSVAHEAGDNIGNTAQSLARFQRQLDEAR